MVQVEGQRADQGASLEELVVDPAAEDHSLVDLASVEVLAPWGQLEAAGVGWPSGGTGCHLGVPYPQYLSHLSRLCIPLLLPLPPPLQELTDLGVKGKQHY